MGVSGRDQPYCEAKFVLKFGAVQGVSYQSRTDDVAKKGEPCAFLVEKCAKP